MLTEDHHSIVYLLYQPENKSPSIILERNIEQKKGHTVLLGFIKHVRHGKFRIIIYIVNSTITQRKKENLHIGFHLFLYFLYLIHLLICVGQIIFKVSHLTYSP